jgi:hypothetical protein
MVLIDTLKAEGEDTSSLNSLVDLNPFAVQYRYESLDSDDEELDRSSVLNEVQLLFDRVAVTVEKLSSDMHCRRPSVGRPCVAMLFHRT